MLMTQAAPEVVCRREPRLRIVAPQTSEPLRDRTPAAGTRAISPLERMRLVRAGVRRRELRPVDRVEPIRTLIVDLEQRGVSDVGPADTFGATLATW